MQKTVVYIAVSLDGFIAGPKNDMTWLDEFNKPGQDYGYSKFIKKVSTEVMGRKTYEFLQKTGEYPKQKTYIVTSDKSIKPPVKNMVIWTKGFKALVKELKKVKQGIIWPVGGGKLISAFINEGLIDEYMIFIIPRILGGGVRLFEDVRQVNKLRLKETKVFKEGLVMLRYVL